MGGMIRVLPALLLLAACSDFPEIGRAEAALANPGATPTLLTAEELAALGTTQPNRSSALAAEAAALRERARRLRAR